MLQSATLRSWGGWLATFALCFQLVISAGHVHLDDITGLPDATLIGHGAGAVFDTVRRADNGPASTDPQAGTATDICAICAAMQMVATAVTALPPALRLPLLPNGAPDAAGVPRLADALPFPLFQPRAPPSA
jgi:hypothetical protein